jgi:branched-chain amino acid transport system permease protein
VLLQILANGFVAGSTYALVALGFGLIYNTVRFFHFAHAGVLTAGAYLFYWLTAAGGWGLGPAAAVAALVTGAFGAGLEAGLFRPLRRRGVRRVGLLLASLGTFIVIQNLISLAFGDDTKTIPTGLKGSAFDLAGVRLTAAQLATAGASLGLFAAVVAGLYGTPVGRVVRAVADDAELAHVVGVQADLVLLGVFFVGSVLAAVAGMLIAVDVNLTPLTGFYVLLYAVVAVVVGGLRSLLGVYGGGLFIGLVQHLAAWLLAPQWQDVVVFALLIGVLVVRPQGFFGRAGRPGEG